MYSCSVSIHAPAWGATDREALAAIRLLVSIHAPAWGATQIRIIGGIKWLSFNPRARMGRDLPKGERTLS